ncbi:MAG: UDP-N-acetylglucosamine 1-carboxyvinyltransferase [Clostridium sp. 26_21]|nr:MAG: UDP-N-acetylglucosamine 1-carboxyvinyltransferase [Clostridium sp. 26_21]
MSRFIIQGGKKLEGEIEISGSKNAALPIIAATVLNAGTTTLYNVPDIQDVNTMFEILKKIGATIKRKNNKIIINTSKIHTYEIPDDLMRQMRSSIILAGALLGKYHKARFSCPGGCDIGSRPIDLHLKGFEKLGVNIKEEYGEIYCDAEKIIGTQIHLDFPSVGATENIILASCLGEGTTVITNAAREPEIEDMIKYLNKMGAKINGAGTDKVEIVGVKKLSEISYNIMPDRIETGTYLVAGAITNGNIKLLNVNSKHIEPILNKLDEVNCKLNISNNEIEIIAPKRVKAVDIKTMPYPGFPTDMQSIFGALLITAKGTSVITENIFESRYKYTQELIRMGAKINVEGRIAIIKGTKKIQGTNVVATDLRGGASLVIAGLYANGVTQIDNIHYILRGYEKMDEKLKKVGAKIYIEK